jgi:glycerol-3-phosphate acyltransferase PlsY
MTILLAAVTGYLCGSISGARIVGRVWARGADLTETRVVLDGTGAAVTTHGVSPSALQARAGAAGGLRAGAIDILKAFIPVLVFRLVWPDGPEHVAAAAAALVGHVYPIYHRFVGGYGISPLLGGLLVVDLPALVVAIAVFGLAGLAVGNAYLGIEAWPIGLIPWFAVFGDGWGLAYALIANLLYWWRSRVEAAGAFRAWRADARPWRQRVADFRTYPDYEVPGT